MGGILVMPGRRHLSLFALNSTLPPEDVEEILNPSPLNLLASDRCFLSAPLSACQAQFPRIVPPNIEGHQARALL